MAARSPTPTSHPTNPDSLMDLLERRRVVASLSELTDRSAVEQALEECLELGPEEFRARYDLDRSRPVLESLFRCRRGRRK